MSEKSQSGDDTSTTEMVGNETRQAKLPKLDAAETGSLKSEKKAKGKSSVAKANEEVDASTTKSRIIAAAVCLVVCAAAVIVGGVLKSSRKSSDNINAAVILDTDWEAPTSSPVMLRAMSSRAPSPMGKTDRDEVVAPLISGRVTLAPSPNASPDDPSNAPFSLTPSIESLEDSREPKCPLGTKAVTIDYVEQSDSYIPPSLATDSDNQQYTLSVKNACYGNVVARCLPCPMKGVASPAWSLNKNVRTRRVDETVFENNDYASTTICIPDMQEYHLEVAPIPSYSDISPCCGLTSNLAPRVTYDGVIVAEGERDAYFGDKEGGCQSQLPSAAPTERPSASPSGYLSSPPSSTPTSSAPTKSPLAFAGPCLEEFVLLSYYSVGTRISRGGFIYECMRVSCGSYGHDPGSSTSNLWRQSWTIVGTCTGTFKPTIDPSRSPTDDPTRMPTSNPTRLPTPRPITPSPTPGRPAGNPTPRPTPECTTERDLPFNMCLAFDMSGSFLTLILCACLLLHLL
ncbi:hypothetical protein THAOC_33082 [Thalassiosira oceanica]|uniref:Uncharacterized protein n=1 Tax=Thalassiosira oceanica TaxID=159749 RepID=K0R5W0_THAOC|nr:hypothetical protein THAOC_33082 [Thalassiosira oceanica]|eukprot:EJK48150.1 hypothetical protein THAOC_33082 [Thalassiosira oceanica]